MFKRKRVTIAAVALVFAFSVAWLHTRQRARKANLFRRSVYGDPRRRTWIAWVML